MEGKTKGKYRWEWKVRKILGRRRWGKIEEEKGRKKRKDGKREVEERKEGKSIRKKREKEGESEQEEKERERRKVKEGEEENRKGNREMKKRKIYYNVKC